MDTILMRHTNGQLRSWAKNYCLLTIMVVQAIITPTLYLTKISMPLKNSIRKREHYTSLLLGTQYALIREEFLVLARMETKDS